MIRERKIIVSRLCKISINGCSIVKVSMFKRQTLAAKHECHQLNQTLLQTLSPFIFCTFYFMTPQHDVVQCMCKSRKRQPIHNPTIPFVSGDFFKSGIYALAVANFLSWVASSYNFPHDFLWTKDYFSKGENDNAIIDNLQYIA